jgi:sugar/nucleoside kinase (ribokinase family)
MKIYDVAVVGEIYVDHVFTGFTKWPQPGEEVFTHEYVQEIGGGAAITACALGHLQRTITIVGVAGKNEMPWIVRRLSGCGVDCTGLHSTDSGTGVTVSVSTSIDRLFFTYTGANTRLEEYLVGDAVLQQLSAARHVHFAFPITAALATRLLEALHGAGCTISLDVGYQVRWLSDAVNLDTCSRVDYLLPNEREANLIGGGDAHDYLGFTALHHWPSGVVKMGAQGALMRGKRGVLHVPALNAEVVDTTGAGDAFNAGFIDGLLDKEPGEECLRRGCLCGGLSTRTAGALNGLPARDELNQYYEELYG